MADPGAAPHPAAAAPCRPCHASGGCDIARNDRYSLDRGAAGGGRGLFGAVLFLGPFDLRSLAFGAWVAGMIAVLVAALVSDLRFRKAVLEEEVVFDTIG